MTTNKEQVPVFLARYQSSATRKNYGYILSSWVESGSELDMGVYQSSLLSRGLTNSSVNVHLVVIEKYCSWRGLQCVKAKALKQNPSVVGYLSDAEVRSLLSSCRNSDELALVRFMIETGVRVSEMSSLSEVPFNAAEGNRFVIIGKGGKQRSVVISDETMGLLRETGYMFGRVRSVVSLQRMLKELARRAGIKKKFHAHMLRHTFAMKMLNDKGVNMTDLQKMMGHSDIKTTAIYAQVSDSRVNKLWEKELVGFL